MLSKNWKLIQGGSVLWELRLGSEERPYITLSVEAPNGPERGWVWDALGFGYVFIARGGNKFNEIPTAEAAMVDAENWVRLYLAKIAADLD